MTFTTSKKLFLLDDVTVRIHLLTVQHSENVYHYPGAPYGVEDSEYAESAEIGSKTRALLPSKESLAARFQDYVPPAAAAVRETIQATIEAHIATARVG